MNGGVREHPIVVLIAAYNAEKTIERAVRSAAARDGAGEVLVIDDGSTDATATRAAAAGARVIVQTNAGPAAARNRGLDEVGRRMETDGHARHVLFLDADDELREGAAAHVLRLIGAIPDASCVVGGHVQVGEKASKERRPDGAWMTKSLSFDRTGETPVPRMSTLPHPGCILGTSHVFCTTGLTLTPRAVRAGLRFDPSLNFGEDRDLIYRAAAVGTVALTDRLLVNKHDEPGRMTASPARLLRWLDDVVTLCDKHDPVGHDRPRADALTQEHLCKALTWITKHAQRGLAHQSQHLPAELDARVTQAFAKRGWECPSRSRGIVQRVKQLARRVLG